MFFSLSLFFSFPANLIFRKSAQILIAMQIEKMTILSSKVFDNDLVVAANHNAITPGFKVLMIKPVKNNLRCVVPDILTPFSISSAR